MLIIEDECKCNDKNISYGENSHFFIWEFPYKTTASRHFVFDKMLCH